VQGEVIKNQDSSSLPAGLCAMVTIQCTAWTIYGYLIGDWSTFANNIVGVILGSFQLSLIAIYPNRRAMKKATDKEKEHGAVTPLPITDNKTVGDAENILETSPVKTQEFGVTARSISPAESRQI
jgi:hypothetical protein